MFRVGVILLMMGLCSCATPVALGTGSAVSDIALGGVIQVSVMRFAPMMLSGVDRLADFGGSPKWAAFIPSGGQRIERINGMTFVGDGW